MTPTRPYQSFLLMLMVALLAGSCTKAPLGPSSVRILGKWKKVKFATDDNSNGTLDSWEFRNANASVINTLDFKKDSTGIESSTGSPDLPFTWYINAEQNLKIEYNTGDAFFYKITRLDGGKLHITAKTQIGLAGYYYDAQ